MPFLMPTIAKSFFPGGGAKAGGSPPGSTSGGGGGSSSGGGDLGEEYLDWLGGGGEGKDMAEGLDTPTSYGSDGMVIIENTTTYIQPIEV